MANDSHGALERIARANVLADMIEIRLDMIGGFDLEGLIQAAQKPVLVTYRSMKEGGKGSKGYEAQVRYLLEAMEAGPISWTWSIPCRRSFV